MFAFAVILILAGETFLRYLSIGDKPSMGGIVLTRSELSTLRRVFAALEQKGWSVRQVSVDGARCFFVVERVGDSEIIICLRMKEAPLRIILRQYLDLMSSKI